MKNKVGWDKIKLKDVGQVVTGNTPKTSIIENYSSKDFCFFKPSDLRGDNISILSKSDNYISTVAYKSTRNIPIGSVLVTCIGTIGNVGVTTVVSATNQQINAIIPGKKITSKFLAYVMCSLRSYLNHIANAPIVPIINKTQFSDIDIYVPSLSIQYQIVSELDTLCDIITKKKQQLSDLDALAQATFYDMFGDPVSNEKGWKKGFLKDHTTKIGSGATPSGGNQNYKSEGISLIRSLNVHNGKFLYKDLAYIDDTQAKQLNNVTVQENDVLINITGASVARSCIVPKNILPARVNQHVSIIRLKSNLNYVFINSLFISHSYQEKLLALGKSNGATREAITKSQLEILEIPIPPISIQNKFVGKIESIEKQKQLINQSVADVQQLFDFTMDKYFN